MTTGAGSVSYEVPDPPDVHGPLVATILDELRGRGACPSTGKSALRTAAAMDVILAG